MLDDLLARDFMVPIEDYPHITASSTVCDAMSLMHSSLAEAHKYRTILVTDENQHLLGYLSLRDLIRAVGPRYLRKEEPDYKGHQPFQGVPTDLSALSLIWQEGFTIKIREEAKKSIKEMMTLIERTVSPEDPFAKCTYLMLVQNELIMPVVEEERVIGVIRLVDIFELIAECLCIGGQDAS
jgi:Mg/Co/Ni transporter MgtE